MNCHARRLAHLRADGRTVSAQRPQMDEMELLETAEIMGSNYCLSEFHAAILMAQLEPLDAQLALRRDNAAVLDRMLISAGFLPQATAAGTTARAHYSYVVRLPESVVEAVNVQRFATALAAELRLPCKTMYAALHDNRLYKPFSRRRFALGNAFSDAVNPSRYHLPVAQAFSRSCIALPHRMLLADADTMARVAAAFEKVIRSIDVLRD